MSYARDWAVAYLVLQRADDTDSNNVDLPIYANAEFDLGREQVHSILGVNDATISNHHLRIHCVTYGENTVAAIEPLVYVRVLSRHGVRLLQSAPDGSNSTCNLQNGQPSVLLNHGDSLHLSSKVFIKYEALPSESNDHKRLGSVAEAEAKRFEDQYTITPRALGAGGFASVFLAVNVKSHRQVACKIVPLPKKPPVPGLSDWDSQPGRKAPARKAVEHIVLHRKKCSDLRREFEVLKGIDHPNIIRLEKAIYATDHIYIFQELVSGGDLLSYLERKGGLDEPEAAVMIFQLLKALEYLNGRGIVHRDIKPENILLTSWRKGARIVLTDFGQSRRLIEEDAAGKSAQVSSRMRSLVGTHGYAAPEVYMRPYDDDDGDQAGYNETVDVWSIGCLAGTLLTNTFLFPRERSNRPGDSADDVPINLDVAFSLDFLDTSADWQRASSKSKSFIRGCTMIDDAQRLTVRQALQHSWVAHPSFAEAMHAEYARAIADWTPRGSVKNLIEYVKDPLPTAKTPEVGYEARLHQEVRSHHFPSQMPPMPSQFRSFDSLANTGTSMHERLSPIRSRLHASPTNATAFAGHAASDGDLGRFATDNSNERRVDDDMSYMSIQNYAPPVIYPTAASVEQSSPSQSQWGMQLAESMDLDRGFATTGTMLPHKNSRI